MSYLGNYITDEKPINGIDLQLVFRGNSLFRSHHGSGIEQYMPLRVRDYFAGKVKSLDFHSFGVGGEFIETMLLDFDTVVAPLIDLEKLSILFLTEDANSIFGNGISAEQNVDYMNQIIDKALAVGFNYIVIMAGWNLRTPYDGGAANATLRAERQLWYNLIENRELRDGVFILDGRSLPIVGGGEDLVQNEYYYDDIHLTPIGYDICADYGLIQTTMDIITS